MKQDNSYQIVHDLDRQVNILTSTFHAGNQKLFHRKADNFINIFVLLIFQMPLEMIQRINSLENVTQFIDEFISKDSADPRETMLLGKYTK